MKALEPFFTFFAAIFTALAAILAAFVTYNWESINVLGKSTLVIIIIAAIFVAFNSIQKVIKESLIEKINAKFGDIKDIVGATYPKIAVGNINDAQVIYSSSEYRTGVFFVEEGVPLVKLYVIKNKLFINVIIRNLDGKEIAVIDDNTWTIYSNDFEYNNDDTAFELVTKGERSVYFQIVFRNGIAHISGCLLNKKGHGVAFFNENNRSLMLVIKPDFKDLDMEKIINLNIPRIFKYPRDKHIGKRL